MTLRRDSFPAQCSWTGYVIGLLLITVHCCVAEKSRTSARSDVQQPLKTCASRSTSSELVCPTLNSTVDLQEALLALGLTSAEQCEKNIKREQTGNETINSPYVDEKHRSVCSRLLKLAGKNASACVVARFAETSKTSTFPNACNGEHAQRTHMLWLIRECESNVSSTSSGGEWKEVVREANSLLVLEEYASVVRHVNSLVTSLADSPDAEWSLCEYAFPKLSVGRKPLTHRDKSADVCTMLGASRMISYPWRYPELFERFPSSSKLRAKKNMEAKYQSILNEQCASRPGNGSRCYLQPQGSNTSSDEKCAAPSHVCPAPFIRTANKGNWIDLTHFFTQQNDSFDFNTNPVPRCSFPCGVSCKPALSIDGCGQRVSGHASSRRMVRLPRVHFRGTGCQREPCRHVPLPSAPDTVYDVLQFLPRSCTHTRRHLAVQKRPCAIVTVLCLCLGPEW